MHGSASDNLRCPPRKYVHKAMDLIGFYGKSDSRGDKRFKPTPSFHFFFFFWIRYIKQTHRHRQGFKQRDRKHGISIHAPVHDFPRFARSLSLSLSVYLSLFHFVRHVCLSVCLALSCVLYRLLSFCLDLSCKGDGFAYASLLALHGTDDEG
jgi:hypothetical protein